jgi:hypothetical protein
MSIAGTVGNIKMQVQYCGCVAPDISKDHIAPIFMDCLTLKKKALCFCKMLGTVHPTVQYHTPEESSAALL